MSTRDLREWVPAPLRHGANALLGANLVFKGPYRDFEEAAAKTRGYDDPSILARVEAATRQVLAGAARFEQDGRAFAIEPPPSHALSALLLAAARTGGKLSVLDFGGGLASHYLRWRPLLAGLPELHWCVVEQPGYVAAGRALHAADPRVAFEESIAGALAHRPNAVLASSVLQYLPRPDEVLGALAEVGADVLVIDRYPRREAGATVALTQHVPRQQGGASYALHAFAPDHLARALSPRYRCLLEFPGADAPLRAGAVRAGYIGSVWARDTGERR